MAHSETMRQRWADPAFRAKQISSRAASRQRRAQEAQQRYLSGQIAGNLLRGELTEFEKAAAQLELSERQWRSSEVLKAWAVKHAESRYVPENLLKHWGIRVHLNDC